MSTHVVVFVTAGSAEEGEKIARALVDERLVACVNMLSPIRSVYRWQGQVQEDHEVLLIAKTRSTSFEQLATRVKQLHSYQVPEIIAVPIVAGAQDYMHWIDEQTGPSEATAGTPSRTDRGTEAGQL
ncbi:MAG: divalent-cation tolerance protein CutA [Chloroflexi bacterium]|nr:divalent-cation tolerance protein CutA [Chloroflexota bacterium]